MATTERGAPQGKLTLAQLKAVLSATDSLRAISGLTALPDEARTTIQWARMHLMRMAEDATAPKPSFLNEVLIPWGPTFFFAAIGLGLLGWMVRLSLGAGELATVLAFGLGGLLAVSVAAIAAFKATAPERVALEAPAPPTPPLQSVEPMAPQVVFGAEPTGFWDEKPSAPVPSGPSSPSSASS